MKKLFWGLLVTVLVLGGGYLILRSRQTADVPPDNRLQVAATIYPLAFLAEEIGGEDVAVTTLVPLGVEPHEYEPTPQEVAKAFSAEVFFVHGGGVDGWAEEIIPEATAEGAHTLLMSDAVPFHEGDPHIWLDPVLMFDLAGAVSAVLSAADPEHADAYATRTATLLGRFGVLHDQYRSTMMMCTERDLYVTHDAYGYLADRYDLHPHSILGISPEEEPSPGVLADLARQAKEQGITTIFFESLLSDDLAKTLADEVGAKTEVLHPVEGLTLEQAEKGYDYFSLMEENLQALKGALMCP